MASPAPIYIYGLCPAPSSALNLPPGLEGDTQLVIEGAIAALVEADLDLEAIQADNSRLLGAVLSHDRVLCDLFQQTTLLPLRFGTQLASLDHLKAHLATEQARYHSKLQALARQAEYQLKLRPLAVTPPPRRRTKRARLFPSQEAADPGSGHRTAAAAGRVPNPAHADCCRLSPMRHPRSHRHRI